MEVIEFWPPDIDFSRGFGFLPGFLDFSGFLDFFTDFWVGSSEPASINFSVSDSVSAAFLFTPFPGVLITPVMLGEFSPGRSDLADPGAMYWPQLVMVGADPVKLFSSGRECSCSSLWRPRWSGSLTCGG